MITLYEASFKFVKCVITHLSNLKETKKVYRNQCNTKFSLLQEKFSLMKEIYCGDIFIQNVDLS